jgi:hypothetical protein
VKLFLLSGHRMSDQKKIYPLRAQIGHNRENVQRISRAQNMEVIEKIGAPGPTRTGDLRIRNPSLYPPELQGQPT